MQTQNMYWFHVPSLQMCDRNEVMKYYTLPLLVYEQKSATVDNIMILNILHHVTRIYFAQFLAKCYFFSHAVLPVADPEGVCGGAAPSKIDQNLAKLAPFVPILASMPP